MFKPGDSVTHSDEGFSVAYLDRLHVLYREGDRTMRIAVEFLATNAVVLETTSICSWEPPYDHDPVSRARISDRVKAALESSGLEVYVDGT